MTKKFAVVKIFGYIGSHVSILDQDGFATCTCDCVVLFESDDYTEVSDWYQNYVYVFRNKK